MLSASGRPASPAWPVARTSAARRGGLAVLLAAAELQERTVAAWGRRARDRVSRRPACAPARRCSPGFAFWTVSE